MTNWLYPSVEAIWSADHSGAGRYAADQDAPTYDIYRAFPYRRAGSRFSG